MGSSGKENSPFMRAMTDVVQGTKQAHHVAEALVRTAVVHTLARVCADYPLDLTSLVAKYEAGVVQSCCAACWSAEARCEAVTHKGTQCTHRASIGGFCSTHIGQWEERAAYAKRVEVHVGAGAVPSRAARVPMTDTCMQNLL